MKIYNKEDKEKIYVQVKDLLFIKSFSNVLDEMHIKEEDLEKFIEFSKKEEIDFFQKQDFIVDYKKYRYLSKKDFFKKQKEILNKMLQLDEKSDEYRKYNYQLVSLPKVYLKRYSENIPYPLVPDSDGKKIKIGNYIIQESIYPNRIMISKSNKTAITSEELTDQQVKEALQELKEKWMRHKNIEKQYEYVELNSKMPQYVVLKLKEKEIKKEIKERKIKKLLKRIKKIK